MTFLEVIFAIFIATVLIGAWVYCALTVIAAMSHLRRSRDAGSGKLASISVLKPLAGKEDSLEQNLRTFFEQDYPHFELLFAIRELDDAAAEIVHRLQSEFPTVSARLIVTGEPPYPNAKVFSLSRMTASAQYDVLVMSDSDVGVGPSFLRQVVMEIGEERYDLATCLYRAVPGRHIWSRLEAIGINTEFWGGALVAKLIEGVKFTVGPTVVARRAVFDAIPWDSFERVPRRGFCVGAKSGRHGIACGSFPACR